MPAHARRLIVLALVVIISLAAAAPARAGEPDDLLVHLDPGDIHRYQPSLDGFVPPRMQAIRSPKTCAELSTSFENATLVQTEVSIGAGGNGSRLCVYEDREWDSAFAVLLNQKTLADWRASKAQYLPLLAQRGMDVCRIGFWASVDNTIKRTMSTPDRHDTGRPCQPQIFAHGSESEARLAEVQGAVDQSMAKAEEIFGWKLTFPIRVHAYDTHIAFVNGVWLEGGDDEVTPRELQDVRGVAMGIANGMYGFLLDLSGFKDEAGLMMLVAHEYAHIMQGGMMGSTANLPFWAIEGGAEYFASQVVGEDEAHIAKRFRTAVFDQFGRTPPALKSLVRRSTSEKLTLAAYSRGLAAFRFLEKSWDAGAYRRLHQDFPAGNPDQFLAGVTSITGLSMEEFDTALGAWLKEQAEAVAAVPNPPQTSLQPGSAVAYLAPVRIISRQQVDETSGYTRNDPTVALLVEWRCLTKSARAEVKVYRPDGGLYASAIMNPSQGCGETDMLTLRLDDGQPGRSMRDIVGTWRVEVHVDKVLHATTSFTVAN